MHRLVFAIPLVFAIRGMAYAAPPLSTPHILVSDVSFDGGVHRVDAVTGQYIDELFTGFNLAGGASMDIGPDGQLYVGSFNANLVHKFDVSTGAYFGIFATGAAGVRGIAFGPNGNLFVASANSNQVKEFNGTTGQFLRNFVPNIASPVALNFGPDGNLYVGRGHHQLSPNESVLVFDGATGALLRTFNTADIDTPQDLLFGPDGDAYVSNQLSQTRAIVRLNGSSGQLVRVIDNSLLNPQGLLFLPDNTLLAATDGPRINRYDVNTGTLLGAFSADGRLGTTNDLVFVVPEPPTVMMGCTTAALIALIILERRQRAIRSGPRQRHS